MVIPLREIFIPEPNRWVYPKAMLPALGLHDAFIADITGQLGLMYGESSGNKSNVCFANSRDLRPEYRTTFEKADLAHYICAFLPGEDANLESDEIPFPENAAAFWSFAEVGHRK